MLIKACLNGAASRADHRAVPITPDELARDARACVDAGARALHLHPRDDGGAQTLAAEPSAAAVQAIRAAVPGVPVGLSTAIEIAGGDERRRLGLVRAWTARPDFASLNMSEPGADELAGVLLDELGVGIEAGVFTIEDAHALAYSSFRDRLVRVLIEVDGTDGDAAVERAWAVEAALDEGGIAAPRLHHGYDEATWAVIDTALARGRDVRVGLEDTTLMPDGSTAPDNAALVAAAVRKARSGGA